MSCSLTKKSEELDLRLDNKLFLNVEDRVLFDSISAQSIQSKDNRVRNLTFANVELEYQFDTLILKIKPIEISWKTYISGSENAKVSLGKVERLKYFLKEDEKEVVRIFIY